MRSYEVDAFDEKDAEDLAWGLYNGDNPDDLNDSFCRRCCRSLKCMYNTN
jgi:hypothetical protein